MARTVGVLDKILGKHRTRQGPKRPVVRSREWNPYTDIYPAFWLVILAIIFLAFAVFADSQLGFAALLCMGLATGLLVSMLLPAYTSTIYMYTPRGVQDVIIKEKDRDIINKPTQTSLTKVKVIEDDLGQSPSTFAQS